ncbi:MAG: MgtC/SapB family protein [Anaerolineales bacterium]|nr:MgtC/SapB family protein [Anaerolineales bacterium]
MDNIFFDNLIKIGLAVLAGGIVGAEREFQDKAAGFRTIILITVGSTLFTIFSMSMDPTSSRTRVAANIVTGIGFLGAGAIVREGGKIGGLTTAATIWLSAALGMGIGAGDLYFSLAATTITLLILLVFPHVETRIDRIRESRTYRIMVSAKDYKKIAEIEADLRACSLKIFEHHQAKSESAIIGTWVTVGAPQNQEKFLQLMMKDKGIKELNY